MRHDDSDEYIRSDKDLAEDYRRGMEAQDRMIADYQRDNEALMVERNRLRDKLTAAREAIDKIVCDEGIDAGVIYLSWESPTHKETIGGKVRTVYDHECFSELGDALVALARLVKED
jgi:hypothetical protein